MATPVFFCPVAATFTRLKPMAVSIASTLWMGRGSAWARAGAWRNTIVGAGLNGLLYTVEKGGALYETNPTTGMWRQIGKPEFAGTNALFGATGWLYSLKAGNLYRINPSNGSWAAIK